MKAKFIDVDNKYREKKRRGEPFPNLAAMKLKRACDNDGHESGFDILNPDIAFVFCVFERNYENAQKEIMREREAGVRVIAGGSGLIDKPTAANMVWDNLPADIEMLMPDYDLYPHVKYSLGFTTRGCIRNCGPCIVHKKEGKFRRAQHIKEFHDFRFKSCKLLDNNILANKEWFFENTNWAIDNKVKLDITQGMDIRLLTDEIAAQLKRVKFVDQQMKFAWDSLDYEDAVINGISILKDHGFNTHRNVAFYVLAGYNTNFCEDVYRCNRLRALGVQTRVMIYNERRTPLLAALARWSYLVPAYWKTPFYQYDRLPKAGLP
jgi:hypothetical protein